MVIDTSALLAIVLGETDSARYIQSIADGLTMNVGIYVPASVLIEAGIAADERGYGEELDELLDKIQPEIVAIDRLIANLARRTARKFGRGHHPAKLNFGDCLSYAVAKSLRLPLLFKGNEFSQTDIRPALSDGEP